MKKSWLILVIAMLSFGCSQDGEIEDSQVPRDSYLKIYCVETFMADVGAWTITFDEGEIETDGRIFSLSRTTENEKIPLIDQTPVSAGLPVGLAGSNGGLSLPYGTYVGRRASDNQEIYISIDELDEYNTNASSSDMRWYKGSTVVDGNESELTCYDAQ